MRRKALSIILAVAMTASLSACGAGKGENESSVSAEGSGDNATENASAQESKTEEGEAGLDLYGFAEPVTIKVGLSYGADFAWLGDETPTENAWMKLYHENNIIPEVIYEVDPSQAETKLATGIMSGEYPDIINANTADYKNYAESGVIADITDAYEKYASEELRAYMASDEGMAIESLYIDGRLYGLPRLSSPYASYPIMFIRQDWLDHLGLSMPQTMEDLKAVAHAFTYDDPDGNGKDDTYGMAIDGINVINNSVGTAEPVFNAYGCYFGTDGMTYVEGENGEVVWGGANAEGAKSALTFLQELYQDGSLAKDFITMDSNSIFEETGSGRCGIWFGPNWGGMNPAGNAIKNDPDAHIVSAPVPNGTQEASKAYLASSITSVYCISSQCENPEALIKMWNLNAKYLNPNVVSAEEYAMYNGDSVNYTGWKSALIYGGGPEGGPQIYANVSQALKDGDTSILNAKELENYTSIKAYVDAVEAGNLDPEDLQQKRGAELYTVYGDPLCAWSTITGMQEDNRFVQSAYNGIPSETVTNAVGTLKKLLVENIVKIITGDSVDNYDTFLDTWYAMGGQDAMDEANGK